MSCAHGVAGWRRAAVVLALAISASRCAAGLRPMASWPDAADRPCRVTPADDGALGATVVWLGPSAADQRRHLDEWCSTVGPPVVAAAMARPTGPLGTDGLVVVSWNVHEGAGDVAALIAGLRDGTLTDGRPVTRFVLLLQEARRAAGAAPTPSRPGADIVSVAREAGLSLYYVASKRLGGGTAAAPDRGNAVLSTEPLSDFRAIELPFERQRRLAVEASISGADAAGTPWRLRLVSAHLESTATLKRLRVLASIPRQRQARALLEAMAVDEPVVLGGDFNTWFGFRDATYRLMAAALPDLGVGDRRRTFGGLFRLDHVFARTPAGWQAVARRLDVRLGSDHFPLLARLTPGVSAPAAAGVAPQSR